jgi:predicted flap endonuclease-1-like 5' DNA nuclease
MIYLLQWYWGWLLLALILGGLVGFYTFEREFKPPAENPLWWLPVRSRWILAILVFGCVVAIMHWFPGRLGFYLDIALLFFSFYIIGCLLGGVLPEVLDRRKAAKAKAQPPAAGSSTKQAKAAAVLPADRPATQPPGPPSAGDTTIDYPGKMPPAIEPPGGTRDDLKRISGVGPGDEQRLHNLGIWHFAQIAAWTPQNIEWVGSYLAFPGRIERERWVEQARDLVRRTETDETQA